MAAPKVIDIDRGWKRVFQAAAALAGDNYAKVGVLAEGKGEEAERGGDLTVAEIAVVMEYGTTDGKIPARSFVRATFDAQREVLAEMGRRLLIEVVLEGKMSVGQALSAMGAKLAAEIKKTITTGAGVPPPNAPATLLRKAMKGRTKKFFAGVGGRARSLGEAFAQAGALASVRPLVDTGRLLGAVTWAVIVGGFGQGLAGGAGGKEE